MCSKHDCNLSVDHVHRETRFNADMEEALVSSKLDAIGQEYNALLAGQLEEQRRWFEGRHAQARADLCVVCLAGHLTDVTWS